MKTNNSFFNPNRLVFRLPKGPSGDLNAAETAGDKPRDFSKTRERTKLFKEAKSHIAEMSKAGKAGKAMPLQRFLNLAKNLHNNKDITEGSKARRAEMLYSKLLGAKSKPTESQITSARKDIAKMDRITQNSRRTAQRKFMENNPSGVGRGKNIKYKDGKGKTQTLVAMWDADSSSPDGGRYSFKKMATAAKRPRNTEAKRKMPDPFEDIWSGFDTKG